jgi:hypothetical protein
MLKRIQERSSFKAETVTDSRHGKNAIAHPDDLIRRKCRPTPPCTFNRFHYAHVRDHFSAKFRREHTFQ